MNELGFVELFVDADGNFVHGVDHCSYDATISANGITINERDRVNVVFDTDGFSERGNQVHILSPRGGGMVKLDPGQLGFESEGISALPVAATPQLFGERFCDALVPTG